MGTNTKSITVLYPGGFKPMTGGHLSLIRKYAEDPRVKLVRVLVGPGERNGIDQDLATHIAEILTSNIDKVDVIKTPHVSPILASYKCIENVKPGVYCLAASTKDDDYKRVQEFVDNHRPGGKYPTPKGVSVVELSIDVEPAIFKNRLDEHKNQPISASVLRNDVINKDFKNFKTGYPIYSKPEMIYGFLQGKVVKDGKNAIKTSRSLTERELFDTYRELSKDLVNILGVKQNHIAPIGSFGKKPLNQKYGDLDIAVKTNLSFEDVANRMEHLGKFETIRMPGFNQVTIGYPIKGDSGSICQVDLMLTEDINWSKFAYDSPNLKTGESKFKGAYSSFMKMAIISEAYKTPYRQDENGNTVEYSMMSMRLNSGIWQVSKSYMGKKGLIKTAKIIQEKIITNDPEDVLKLAFGEDFDKSKSANFEYIWKFINSPTFIHKNKLYEIMSKFHHLKKNAKLPPVTNLLPKISKRQLNDHMYHIEQLLFHGEEGLNFIKYTFNQLCMTGIIDSQLSIKIDGAPAMMLWSKFPGLKPYGVGTKTVFNKTPVTCHSHEEVDEKFGDRPDLADKLKHLLTFAEYIEIPSGEIWQGDFLFNTHSKETDRKTYVSFRPNTIRYSLDIHSQEGIKVLWSVFGIAWHTRYTGDDIKNVQAHFNVDLEQLVGHPSLYMTSPYFKQKHIFDVDVDKVHGFTVPVLREFYKKLDHLKFNNQYKAILGYKSFELEFEKFHNYLIKNRQQLSITKFKEDFISFIDQSKSKVSISNMSEFVDENLYAINSLIDLTNDIIEIKNEFLKVLNTYETYEAYVDLKEGGSKRINQEGFALSSPSGKVVKIVDRAEFFYLNSSPNILKGWEKESVKI